MLLKLISFTLLFTLISFQLQESNGSCMQEDWSIAGIIINAIKQQIAKLLKLIDEIIEDAVQELDNMKNEIIKLTESAIKSATDAIVSVIDDALGIIRKIAEDAIDAGINITECYVDNVDKLNIIRRQLIVNETKCATNQLGEFNTIIDGAVKNFTADLQIIGALPGRLQDCLTSLNVITCVTDLVTDVANLQVEIPQQVLEIMLEISNYMTYFEQRLHKCQFDELREANNESRKIIDEVKFCVNQTNISTTESFVATIV